MQQKPAEQANKAGASKFDQQMKSQGPDKSAQVAQTQQVNHASNVNRVDASRRIDQMARTDKAELAKQDRAKLNKNGVTGKGMDPVNQKSEVNKSGSMVMSMLGSLEKGQVNIDKLINGSMTGGTMSNAEMLQLQAGMYKYTQELDLCSKVVEKATTGLKDTLKTNV